MRHEEAGDDAAEMQALELEGLKSKANLLGIKFHPSIGVEALREKIQAKLAETASPEEEEPAVAEEAKETPGQFRARHRLEATKLVRVRVTCMNPFKKDIEGEIFTVSNSVVGTVKKYVPFNADEGWHVPQIILNAMRERMCQVFVKEKTKNGVSVKRGKLIKEFNIEVLPPLTEDELHDLAQRQAMRGGA